MNKKSAEGPEMQLLTKKSVCRVSLWPRDSTSDEKIVRIDSGVVSAKVTAEFSAFVLVNQMIQGSFIHS